MSGGVDSFVAALLLKEQGYEVTGLTMINWSSEVAVQAASAAAVLNIPHIIVDLHEQFREKVIDYFVAVYEQGSTPNPCVVCNRFIKFGSLLDYALDLGFDMVATGHYARIEYDDTRKRYLLKKGKDLSKDQSYFLYGLNQKQLSYTLFPLGELTKQEVRSMARERNLEVAESKDSQEICFITGDYRDFLQGKLQFKPGQVVDLQGNILGEHRGLPFYTVGQRKGLGISGRGPLYVVALDSENNRLVLDKLEHLYETSLTAVNNNLIYYEKLDYPLKVEARIRYRAPNTPALLTPQGDKLLLEFDNPQRAITPGQSVVYYLGDYVLGGGTIQ
ncbi:MAG TPA: tRNA 2-thiouridine(34) synthase MnmA [Syntrophomonas sp.]|jgi:tRNA-specific 2-thiouridylase|nr:tRNA 2-thiouridine(34) synthase MnmA [Syntrophomonas sp.]